MADIAAGWMAGSALGGALVLKAVDWFLARKKERTETDANVTLVQGLTERIEHLEKAQRDMATRLDDEITQRQRAQEEAHKLRLRIITLETTLRQLGAVIPPEAA